MRRNRNKDPKRRPQEKQSRRRRMDLLYRLIFEHSARQREQADMRQTYSGKQARRKKETVLAQHLLGYFRVSRFLVAQIYPIGLSLAEIHNLPS